MPNRPVSEVIRGQQLVIVDRETSVQDAASQMEDANIGAVLVVENGQVTGIFTERDCLYRVVAQGKHPEEVKVGEVLTDHPSCVQGNRPFSEALYLMFSRGFRHVPVLDDNNHPIGIVTPRFMLGSELIEFEHKEVDREHLAEIL